MLTFIEAVSLAGDRAKQNDDAWGWLGDRAWVIDGATDLHDAPLTGWASDASWIAHFANARLHGSKGSEPRDAIFEISTAASLAFRDLIGEREYDRWQSPVASLLIADETKSGVTGLDLGDCRAFALDANGAVCVKGGAEGARDAEARAAAKQADADKPLLQRAATIDMLRRSRASFNQSGGHWTFGLDPACADRARLWDIAMARPAHLLLMTDGFSVLTDQYAAYDAGGLVRAALDKGLQELGREVRAIEAADAGGAKHPRFKPSDDATAVLLRLS